MGTIELDSKVKELRELRRMADELNAEIEAITDSIKTHMTKRETDELTGSDWKIAWKPITTARLDTAALKEALPEIVKRFTKTTTSRRFTVA